MDPQKKYVGDMAVGREYRIIDNWDISCNKRPYPYRFNGTYIRKYHLPKTTCLVFLVHGDYRHINSINDFYLILPILCDKIQTQIQRNVLMKSHSLTTLPYIDSIIRQKKLPLYGGFSNYLNEF